MPLVPILLGALTVSGLVLAISWARAKNKPSGGFVPTPRELLIGFVTNFFDTLGIGSFAPTTAIFRLFSIVPDELIPGTLIVGHALPIVAQALFFVSTIAVDPLQMTAMIVACVAGGWLGAGVVASLPRRAVQLGMGCALAIAAAFMLTGMLGTMPTGGTALHLKPLAFAIALAISAILGAFLTLGIGNYAPSLVTFSLLGMDPRAAFPIMMGSGAFVGTIAGLRFVKAGRFHSRVALGLTLGGIPAVIVAATVVKSMPLGALRWLVVIVVSYASVTLLRAGLQGQRTPERAQEAA
ncbi:MAG: hypothetical protein MNPFHGCM_01532 [Gemmatimonadaceae bacterium]|nr:hypothetical protein [Gemmatimonadaceae bacterium]